MPRPKHCRRIVAPPLMQGYKPFGISAADSEPVILHFDEYEAIRLLDYEGLLQEQAAERMNVSRSTLTRIYEQARHSIASAFVAGRMIVIEGGNVEFGKDWFRCKKCHKLVDGKENHVRCHNCCRFGDEELSEIKGSGYAD